MPRPTVYRNTTPPKAEKPKEEKEPKRSKKKDDE